MHIEDDAVGSAARRTEHPDRKIEFRGNVHPKERDIIARKAGRPLKVKAKGASRLRAMRASAEPNTIAAIASPDNQKIRDEIQKAAPALSRIPITTFWVEDRSAAVGGERIVFRKTWDGVCA